MLGKLILITCALLIANVGISAQDSCSCSNSVCSASQTCSGGKTAKCTCSATGCSSSCENTELQLEFTEPDFEKAVQAGDRKAIRQYFAKTIGRTVDFVPTSSRSKVSYIRSKDGNASHWDALEFLEKNGDLKIDGHSLKFWTDIRDSFLNGGELTICTSRADVALREISFISGKRFSVISGDPKTKLDGEIRGEGVVGLLQSLKKAAKIEIVER